MGSRKTAHKKIRLGKALRKKRWAPFWVIFKAKGIGKKIHPSRLTRVKRNWRRTKLDIKNKKLSKKKLKIKSGKKKKKI